jgi:hypothetical protein
MERAIAVLSLFLVVLSLGCQAEKTVEQASMEANRHLAIYRAELTAKSQLENTYYETATTGLRSSAADAQFVDLGDQLTRSSRAFVLDFINRKPDSVSLGAQLESVVVAFSKNWQAEDDTRESSYNEALAALQKNHEAIVAAQDKLASLSGKLRVLSLPYSNGELFNLLVAVGEKVKSELDKKGKQDTAAAAANAKTATVPNPPARAATMPAP